ncbi:MAG TPA: gliding motility-associated C-terminal domain-containing protein, partial [Flavobacteriales bacterium]|nr:gliding motility-associated C-terminal domain-containing protein [Flavobacteriales bacterium]
NEVHFHDLSVPNATSWWWDFGEDLGTSTAQDTTIVFPNEVGGSYPVTFVVANYLGCTDTLRSVVEVNDEFLVWIPNAFTPNAEGGNETFYVVGNDISPDEYQMRIFDRWGREVFSSTKLEEKWDGTSGGDVLPQGVYVYRLKLRSLSTTKKRTILGHVTLLR